jgi:hypothetical protein
MNQESTTLSYFHTTVINTNFTQDLVLFEKEKLLLRSSLFSNLFDNIIA